MYHNQPYDESLDVPDSEDVASLSASSPPPDAVVSARPTDRKSAGSGHADTLDTRVRYVALQIHIFIMSVRHKVEKIFQISFWHKTYIIYNIYIYTVYIIYIIYIIYIYIIQTMTSEVSIGTAAVHFIMYNSNMEYIVRN